MVGWLVLAGGWAAVAGPAPWLGLAAWVAYVTQWQPCLVVDGSTFAVVNGVRTHRIPVGVIEDVGVRYTVTVTAAGKRYRSWGCADTARCVRCRRGAAPGLEPAPVQHAPVQRTGIAAASGPHGT